MSDLLHAFDFDNPNYDFPDLPDTSNNTNASHWQCEHNPPPKVPTMQIFPTQEAGTKISRALPYKFNISDRVDTQNSLINISMANVGEAAVVFHVFDYINTSYGAKKYTIEPGKELWDIWDFHDNNAYNLSLHGPNGFVRTFVSSNALLSSYNIYMKEDRKNNNVIFKVACLLNECNNKLLIEDKGYGKPSDIVKYGELKDRKIINNVISSGNWYDFVIKEVNNDKVEDKQIYERRFMGRIETDKDSITDPAMAVPRKDNQIHPRIKAYFDAITRNGWYEPQCKNRYHKENGFVKDVCYRN